MNSYNHHHDKITPVWSDVSKDEGDLTEGYVDACQCEYRTTSIKAVRAITRYRWYTAEMYDGMKRSRKVNQTRDQRLYTLEIERPSRHSFEGCKSRKLNHERKVPVHGTHWRRRAGLGKLGFSNTEKKRKLKLKVRICLQYNKTQDIDTVDETMDAMCDTSQSATHRSDPIYCFY